MPEPAYEVVWPLGRLAAAPIELAARPTDPSGMTIAELSDYGFRAEAIFPVLRELLAKQYPGIRFVEYTEFGNTHGPDEVRIIAGLADKLKALGCDAVISGVGG
jgi:hypothetical protein